MRVFGAIVLVTFCFLLSQSVGASETANSGNGQSANHQRYLDASIYDPEEIRLLGTYPEFGKPIVLAPTYYLEEPAEPDNGPRGFPWVSWDGWVAIFTACLFVSTGLLWWVTRQTLAHAEKSSERQLRAYVFAVPVSIMGGFDVGDKPTCGVQIKNFGATPAYDVVQWVRIGIQHFPLDAQLPFGEIPAIPNPKPLAPGDDKMFGKAEFKDGLTAIQAANLANKKSALFFLGKIQYRDAFGHQRTTTYCFFSGGPEAELGEIAAYREGNSAD